MKSLLMYVFLCTSFSLSAGTAANIFGQADYYTAIKEELEVLKRGNESVPLAKDQQFKEHLASNTKKLFERVNTYDEVMKKITEAFNKLSSEAQEAVRADVGQIIELWKEALVCEVSGLFEDCVEPNLLLIKDLETREAFRKYLRGEDIEELISFFKPTPSEQS